MKKVYALEIEDMGYKEVWNLQEYILSYNLQVKKFNATHQESKPTLNVYITCEHRPVYTLGKSGKMDNLKLSEGELKERNIEFHRINRGGDITYHGPGQITGYPVLDLESFKPSASWYIEQIEEMAQKTLDHYNLEGTAYPGLTGVWLEPETERARKICAIGVKMSRWVTIHGFAFNVNTDLDYFNHIIPCGIDDKGVTSLKNELGHEVSIAEVANVLKEQFCQLFDASLEPISMEDLKQQLTNGGEL